MPCRRAVACQAAPPRPEEQEREVRRRRDGERPPDQERNVERFDEQAEPHRNEAENDRRDLECQQPLARGRGRLDHLAVNVVRQRPAHGNQKPAERRHERRERPCRRDARQNLAEQFVLQDARQLDHDRVGLVVRIERGE
jgi:hypothetical protein